jgi:hypothetical protein
MTTKPRPLSLSEAREILGILALGALDRSKQAEASDERYLWVTVYTSYLQAMQLLNDPIFARELIEEYQQEQRAKQVQGGAQ